MTRKPMQADDVAHSAEQQLINLKKAQNKKMQEVMKQRSDIVNKARTMQTIAYAVGNTYKEVFPGAEGFIELRIKTPDSITTKARNEFTEILNEMQENPHINQEEILKRIAKIDFKDILAFTVITTDPPKKFRTGNDELNAKLTALVEELEVTKGRTKRHKGFIEKNEKEIRILSNEINELKLKIPQTMSAEEKNVSINSIKEMMRNSNDSAEIETLIEQLSDLIVRPDKDMLSNELKDKMKQSNLVKENVEYGERNLDRTEETYFKTLRELQYEMSAYFVSNLAKFSTFKFWGTKEIRQPKLIQKPGFRALNTGYSVIFSKDKNQFKLKFEAQGKGKLDYDDAEFTALGAIYHEEQKTKDGLISKKTDMPDFTIIGEERTRKIEKSVRRKYQEINSIEDLAENLDNLDNKDIENEYKILKEYEEKITAEIQGKYGDNYWAKKEIKRKMNEAFNAGKESLIQNEIEDKINQKISEFANSEFIRDKIEQSEELTKVYDTAKESMQKSTSLSPEEIENKARVRVMYYAKEREILEYAKNSIPIFSRVNISNNPDEEIMVYTFTTGESVYRYFYNKLNGLKDENGKYKFEPKEQQKRALLKLTGLFEENDDNFYTYYKDSDSFGRLESLDSEEQR